MTPDLRRPVCNALWVDRALGPLERACLASFVEAGHPVHLYAYDALEGVPAGVTVRDAASVLPRGAIVRHRATGSVSLFSNRFRYALFRRGRGVWIDCDVLCVRPLEDAPCLFGRQDERRINGAVLRLPQDHPVLRDLEAVFETPRWVPPWLRIDRRVRCAIRYRTRARYGLADLRWGTTGPEALTWFLGRHGLAERALPTDVFYPVTFREARRLLDPRGDAVRAHVTGRTRCVHLWRQALGAQAERPPQGSFVHAVLGGRWRALLAADRGEATRSAAVALTSAAPEEPSACASPFP